MLPFFKQNRWIPAFAGMTKKELESLIFWGAWGALPPIQIRAAGGNRLKIFPLNSKKINQPGFPLKDRGNDGSSINPIPITYWTIPLRSHKFPHRESTIRKRGNLLIDIRLQASYRKNLSGAAPRRLKFPGPRIRLGPAVRIPRQPGRDRNA